MLRLGRPFRSRDIRLILGRTLLAQVSRIRIFSKAAVQAELARKVVTSVWDQVDVPEG